MTDNISPDRWGPIFWAMYHIYAQAYPNDPPPAIKDAASAFIKSIPFTLPCASCANHAYAYIQQYTNRDIDLRMVVQNKQSMIIFFIDFHNTINFNTGKPMLSYEDAMRKWKL